MSRSWIIRFLAVAAGFLAIPFISVLSLPPAASAAPQQSGIRQVEAAPMIPHGAQSLGALSSSAPVTGAVVLKPRDEGAVKAFISAVTDKKSPQFHHYLAPGQYATAFGPTAATID